MKVFEMLRLQAERDVDAVNNSRDHEPKFEFVTHSGIFSVVRRQRFSDVIGVRFTLHRDEIHIDGQGVPVNMVATLTLNDAGECRLRVGERELDRWQVLRRALEPLLFGPND